MKQNFSSKHCISNNKEINTINLSLFFTVCECRNLKNCPKVTNFWALKIYSCEENLSRYSIFCMQKPMDLLVAM